MISSSKSKAGEIVNAHLENALVVDGVTVAPAGAPLEIKIADASPASNPDVYGFVDIYFRPLVLADGRAIPLRALSSHLFVHVSEGHESTVEAEDTVGDIFTPSLLYHFFRNGRNFTLAPGARLHALTEATIVAHNGTFAIETPAPLVLDGDTPVSSFKAAPIATAEPSYKLPLSVPTLTPNTPQPGMPQPEES